MVLAGTLTLALYKSGISGVQADLIAGSWLAAGAAAIAAGGLAVIPLALWIQMVRGTGYLWLYYLDRGCRGLCGGKYRPVAVAAVGPA